MGQTGVPSLGGGAGLGGKLLFLACWLGRASEISKWPVRLARIWTEDENWGVSMSVGEAVEWCDCPEEQVRREESQGTPAPGSVVDEDTEEKGEKVPQDKWEDSRAWHRGAPWTEEVGQGARCCWWAKWTKTWVPGGLPQVGLMWPCQIQCQCPCETRSQMVWIWHFKPLYSSLSANSHDLQARTQRDPSGPEPSLHLIAWRFLSEPNIVNVRIHKGLDVPTLTRNGLHRGIRWEEPSNMLDRLSTGLLNMLVMQISNLNKTNWITIYITKMWFRVYFITIPSCLCVCEAKASCLVLLLSITISAGQTLRISMVLTRPVTLLRVCCIEKPGSAQT